MPAESSTARITSVGEIMSERLQTINLLNSAQEAAIKMSDRDVSSLVVLDDNSRAVGIITERDLARRVCTKDMPSSSVTIENVISSPVKTVVAETPIQLMMKLIVYAKEKLILALFSFKFVDTGG
jgi:signal-transduction protein with cAMP-binding, CBS, and nucleotidyltransferase domain